MPFAIPDGTAGSGLTVLVGPNNGGKSTVIEALRAFTRPAGQLTFSEGQRNKDAGDEVHLELTDEDGASSSLDSTEPASSQVTLTGPSHQDRLFVVPAQLRPVTWCKSG